MAGSDPGFNAAEFRDAIHTAMRMGAAVDPTHRLTFRWTERDTYATTDPGGRPLVWTQSPVTATVVADLQVDCAFRFAGQTADTETAVGDFNPAHIIVTLLDTEYDAILAHGAGRFADLILADDDMYRVQFIPPPSGLFDVTVWEVHATTDDET